MAASLHPLIFTHSVDGQDTFSGGKLHCHCSNNKVEVSLGGNVLHNHACGCSKCWKPEGATLAVIGVIPVDQVKVTAHGNKLKVLDENAAIQRNACTECGVHMFGRIEKDHPFKGLDFVHVELSDEKGWQPPQFAAFVSSIIEQGYDPKGMDEVRDKLRSVFGEKVYDCLSPALMDLISTYTAKQLGTLKANL